MIREYTEKDRDAFNFICLETAPSNMKHTEKDKQKLLARYCNYYIDKCSNFCFALADEENTPKGYVLCCEDSIKFKKEFISYIKDTTNFSKTQLLELVSDVLLYLPFHKKYPAHLHIDILEDYRHKGNGKRLILALCERLKEQNIKGVMLCVSAKNTNAIKFYKAVGFEKVMHLPTSYILGKKL